MGAAASLSETSLQVEPGGEASVTVRVRNTGSVVDEFTIDVVGTAAAWSTAVPPTVSMFPGAEETVTVTFRPPRDSEVQQGAVDFGVRVASREDPEGSTVEEGVLELGEFADVSAELIPRSARGRRRAVIDLAIDNRGNAPLNASVAAADPDTALLFEAAPAAVVAQPGTAAFTKIEVKPRSTFFRGTDKSLPFVATVTPEGREPVTADGMFVQQPLLPKWWWKLLLALLVLLLLLVALWYTLLKPKIDSAAKDAVAEQIAPVADQAAAADKKAAAADKKAGDAQKAAESGGGGGGGGGTETTTTTKPASTVLDIGDAVDFRLQATPAAGAEKSVSFTAPDGKLLSVTDVVFENPNGDTGRIQVKRGSAILMESGLGNFRDLDYHFVTPLKWGANEPLTLTVICQAPGNSATGTPAPTCTAAAYFSGGIKAPG